ncbi:MAG: HD-GYP domain-containing protein [Desulfovibrionaceae bacterium]
MDIKDRLAAKENEGKFSPVSPMLLRPWSQGSFAVYLSQGDQYVLYTNKGGAYTEKHRQALAEMDVDMVHVPRDQLKNYEAYLLENLGDILTDESIPLSVRGQAWFEASMATARSVFEEKLPRKLFKVRFSHIRRLVRDSVAFFDSPGALHNVTRLVSKGYKGYHHSMGTMVLNFFVLRGFGEMDQDGLTQASLGALLHDVGKVDLPEELLTKKPESLSRSEEEQFRTHPSRGVGMCIGLPLDIMAQHCILFHHEQENGEGYPAGLAGDAIPLPVKTLSVCNVYDALTRPAPWRPAYSPYEALQKLSRRKSRFHGESLRRLILLLAKAEIIEPERLDEKHG